MTNPQRVVLNIVATYGKSLVALVCGLFTARWILEGLGSVGYGLVGVLVGMTGFVSVASSLLATALARFYAVALGRETGSKDAFVHEWFSAGVVSLFIIGTLMVVVGYPLGEFALRHWLTVPDVYVDSCLWSWRWCCIGCWFGMIATPWTAMFTAKQRIAELSGYAVVAGLANVVLAGWVACRRGELISEYLFGLMSIGVLQNLAVIIQAQAKFHECRGFAVEGLKRKIGELLRYSAFNSVQATGWLLSNNGMAMLVNKLCGPVMNGSLTISNSLKNHASQLSTSLQGAFTPVIATAWGAGDEGVVRDLALRVSKLAVVTIAIFALPLAIEAEDVLILWLKTPPDGCWELSLAAMAVLLADAFGVGYRTAIYATGKIGRFAAYGESVLLFTLPLALLMWWCGLGVWAFGVSYLVVTVINVIARLVFARRIIGASLKTWCRELVLPSCGVIIACVFAGLSVRQLFDSLWIRLLVTSAVVEIVLLLIAWTCVFSSAERTWVKGRQWRR